MLFLIWFLGGNCAQLLINACLQKYPRILIIDKLLVHFQKKLGLPATFQKKKKKFKTTTIEEVGLIAS